MGGWRRVGARRVGAPKGGSQKGGGPNPEKVVARRVGARIVGARRVGARRVGARRVGTRRVGPPNPEKVGARRVGAKSGCRKGGGSKGGGPKISRFFFPLPPPFSLFFSPSLGVFSWKFWWCLKRRGTFEGLGLQNATKNQREDPQRGKKRTNFAAGEGKKERNFGRSRERAVLERFFDFYFCLF